MPAPLLHLGANVLCAHSGTATPIVPNPRVMLSGQPAATIVSPYVIAGCPFPTILGGPCVTGQFITAALRIKVGGAPVLLLDSQGICAPTGVPLIPVAAQPLVTGA